ncbi:MAG: hypothetical protein IKL59_08830 [Clostridia bacterium]|nr:hypothetical protein [Clostridia bacterium]
MRSFKKYIAVLLCLLTVALSLASCRGGNAEDTDTAETGSDVIVIGENSFYSTIALDEYVSLCQYTGLTFDISGTDGSREDMESAVSKHIYEKSEIKKYPEAPIAYYFEQEKSFYMYLAKGDTDQYVALLAEEGVSEQDLRARAEKYVAEDLVFYAITKVESIAVSETEKAELFDKYAKEYVDTYGYTEEYVRENLSDLIYDSMLFDKTMEFLIANNTFVSDD